MIPIKASCTCRFEYVPDSRPGDDGIYNTNLVVHRDPSCPLHVITLTPAMVWELLSGSVASADELQDRLDPIFGIPRTRLRRTPN